MTDGVVTDISIQKKLAEISRLRKSDAVKLAEKAAALDRLLAEKLTELRRKELEGMCLADCGINIEMLEAVLRNTGDEEYEWKNY